MRRKRQRIRSVVLCSLAIACAPGFILFTSRPHVVKAQRLVACRGCLEYYWLSEHEILAFRYRDRWSNYVESTGQYQYPGSYADIVRIDTRTGMETHLASLLKALNRGHASVGVDKRISPDGKQLVWMGNDGAAHTSTLDGTLRDTWKESKFDFRNPDLTWLGDGQRLTTVTYYSKTTLTAITRTPDHHITARSPISMPALPPSDFWSLNTQVASDGRILLPTYLNEPHPHQATILTIDLKRSHAVPYTFPLPRSENVNSILISPRGDRIAWVFAFPIYAHSGMEALLINIRQGSWTMTSPLIGFGNSLWISSIDGSDMHEIGPFVDTDGMYGLQWMPDSRRLSFLLDKNLYTIDVEQNGLAWPFSYQSSIPYLRSQEGNTPAVVK